MFKKAHLVLASLVLLGTFAVNSKAQSRSRQELRVNVPFGFTVGNTSLPAGEYRVSIANPTSDRSVIQIAAVEGKSKIMVLTNDVKGREKGNARLAFRHYGNQYFLAQVWLTAEQVGLETLQSRMEKQLQRQLGNGAKKLDMVAVNAH